MFGDICIPILFLLIQSIDIAHHKHMYKILVVLVLCAFAAADPLNLRRSVTQTTQTPLNDIVPILECIDMNNKAYFSYQNNAGTNVTVGLSDLNRLTPLNIAPITDFVNGSGPAFPFSSQVSLDAYQNSTFNWDLEYYYLPFNITPESACPKKLNLTISGRFDVVGYFDWATAITNAFVKTTNVSSSRIVITNVEALSPAKRTTQGSLGGSLTVELELSDGNATSSEPTAAEVVENLVNNQQQQFNQSVKQEYSSEGDSQIDEIVPKNDPTPSIYGQVRPPTSEPVAAPVDSTPVNPPTSVPVSSPKPKLSDSTLLSVCLISLMINIIVSM